MINLDVAIDILQQTVLHVKHPMISPPPCALL